MECFIAKYSDKGGRDNNEDYIGISENVFVLADGLGGHSNGETASKTAVEFVLENAETIRSIDNDTMHDYIVRANKAVFDNRVGNMATTIVSAFVKEGYFNYLNVGDSRLYYFRRGKIILQSRDHSVTQACVDMGEIKPEKMRFHPDRNKLTKALGLKSDIQISQKFNPIEIECGDAFLLCSDGFWEYLYEKEMIKYLSKSYTPQEWLERMLKKIMTRVGKNNDNISAICVYIR